MHLSPKNPSYWNHYRMFPVGIFSALNCFKISSAEYNPNYLFSIWRQSLENSHSLQFILLIEAMCPVINVICYFLLMAEVQSTVASCKSNVLKYHNI